MDLYMDIRLLPDPEFPPHQLMNALFSKFHRCLARLKSDNIGVSFPEADETVPKLGQVLRIHGTEASLSSLMAQSWLVGMRDHIHIGSVAAVPRVDRFQRVRRVQTKSNPDRIRRRQMKRHGWTEGEARQKIPDSVATTVKLPFLSLESKSTGHRFHLFIRHESTESSSPGTFNAYGLSSTATVPLF